MRNLALACAAVGLVLSARAYPAADPVRDAAQLRLLARFQARLPDSAPWQTELPLPIPGDLRALDAFTKLRGRSIGVEAETRVADIQAVARKVQLKKRDARLDAIILLISDTRADREALALHREALRAAFALDTRTVMEALAAGDPPPADGIVVLGFAPSPMRPKLGPRLWTVKRQPAKQTAPPTSIYAAPAADW